MAITRCGVGGPMAAYAGFEAKTTAASAATARTPLLTWTASRERLRTWVSLALVLLALVLGRH